MNISLTTELEEFVKVQVASGHYTSASEVIRDALRAHIRSRTIRDIQDRLDLSRHAAALGNFKEADDAYFEGKRQYIRDKYLSHQAVE